MLRTRRQALALAAQINAKIWGAYGRGLGLVDDLVMSGENVHGRIGI